MSQDSSKGCGCVCGCVCLLGTITIYMPYLTRDLWPWPSKRQWQRRGLKRHPQRKILETCDLWETDDISDNWEQQSQHANSDNNFSYLEWWPLASCPGCSSSADLKGMLLLPVIRWNHTSLWYSSKVALCKCFPIRSPWWRNFFSSSANYKFIWRPY